MLHFYGKGAVTSASQGANSGASSGAGTTGASDYTKLSNLPTINGVVVKGNLTSQDLGITVTNTDTSNCVTKEEFNSAFEGLEQLLAKI